MKGPTPMKNNGWIEVRGPIAAMILLLALGIGICWLPFWSRKAAWRPPFSPKPAQLGNLTYGVPSNQRFLATPFGDHSRNYSERTAEQIDEEVRRLVDRLHMRVKEILARRQADLERIVQELVRKETLDRAELQRLVEAPIAATQEASLP